MYIYIYIYIYMCIHICSSKHFWCQGGHLCEASPLTPEAREFFSNLFSNLF